jgi:hypothetical protein
MNEVCARCEAVYPYEAATSLGLPREYCECGGALRAIPDPSPKLDVRGAGPHRNQRPFDCGFGVTLGRAGPQLSYESDDASEDWHGNKTEAG